MTRTGSTTPAFPLGLEPGEYVLRARVGSGALKLDDAPSATRTGCRTSMFSSYLLPLMASVAAFGAPVPPAMRRVFSAADSSRSEIRSMAWVIDEFVSTQEMATVEQIDALNALLALPAVEGFYVDLPDD